MPELNWDQCPWTGKTGLWPFQSSHHDFTPASGDNYKSTQSLTFHGGWKPNDDITLNKYGGIYDYDIEFQDPNNPDSLPKSVVLEVVPDWDQLTWMGAAPYCKATKDSCRNAFNDWKDGEWSEHPVQWTGYVASNGDSKYKRDNNLLIQIPNDGCNQCSYESYPQVLCTKNAQMIPNSCPGYSGDHALTKKPTVVELDVTAPQNEYYDNLDLKNYPRGRGKCRYDIDTIQNDEDLRNLLYLKRNKQIHPHVVDELAAKYCYTTVSENEANSNIPKTCGTNPQDGTSITSCPRYLMNEHNNLSAPCVSWRNDLIGDASHSTDNKTFLDKYAKNWCNNPTNKYSPLCDCINKDTNNATKPIAARTLYHDLTTTYSDILDGNNTTTPPVPNECWYEPCKNNSYSIPLLSEQSDCKSINNVCNQINQAGPDGKNIIANNSQFLVCVANGSDQIKTDAANIIKGTKPASTSSIFSNPYIILSSVITIIYFVIIAIKAVMAPTTAGISTSTTRAVIR